MYFYGHAPNWSIGVTRKAGWSGSKYDREVHSDIPFGIYSKPTMLVSNLQLYPSRLIGLISVAKWCHKKLLIWKHQWTLEAYFVGLLGAIVATMPYIHSSQGKSCWSTCLFHKISEKPSGSLVATTFISATSW